MRALTLSLGLLLGTATLAAAVCPNGIVEPPETCDDGNLVAGDGCSPLCLLEVPNLPPSCTGAFVSPDALWPPNHGLVPLAIYGVVDPEDDPIALTVTAIAQDEPVGGSGSCPDATGVGTDVPAVRAERDGSGDGRVYHVAFRASDPYGGFCDGMVAVCVRHDNGKKGSVCVDEGPLYDSTAAVCGPADDGPGHDGPGDDDCDDECILPPPPFVGTCDGVPVPRGVTRRVARAQRLLARAQNAGPKRQRRLTRRAQANLARAGRVVATRLPDPCRLEYGRLLEQTERCGTCVEDHDGGDD
jgi:cysteine-rich repeat protein